MLGTFVADAITLLETLGEPAIVVGHSLGGRVATALGRPDLVRALVLEDPALADGTVTPPGFIEEQRRFLATFDDGVAPEIDRMSHVTAWSPPEILEWAACKALVDRRMIDRLELGPLRRGALNDLAVPALLLADADGPLAPDEGEITNPLVRVVRLDDVSHCVRRDAPSTFFTHANEFLAEHRTAPFTQRALSGVTRVTTKEYLEGVERLAHEVTNVAADQGWLAFGDEGQQDPDALHRAVNDLASHLRFQHCDGGGCLPWVGVVPIARVRRHGRAPRANAQRGLVSGRPATVAA